jgi:hypothetical protein
MEKNAVILEIHENFSATPRIFSTLINQHGARIIQINCPAKCRRSAEFAGDVSEPG